MFEVRWVILMVDVAVFLTPRGISEVAAKSNIKIAHQTSKINSGARPPVQSKWKGLCKGGVPSTFSGDFNDAVATPKPVDGRIRGIFEDFNIIDVSYRHRPVDAGQTAAYRRAVNYEEGLLAQDEAVLATDGHRRARPITTDGYAGYGTEVISDIPTIRGFYGHHVAPTFSALLIRACTRGRARNYKCEW